MAFKRMFSYADVDIPNRSGHDISHKHGFSLYCGTLTPSFVDFLIPGDIVDLAGKFSVQLPPQSTDYQGNVNLRTELFFIPMRSLWAGWKDFISYPSDDVGGPAPEDPNFHAKFIPGAIVSGTAPYANLNVNLFDSAKGTEDVIIQSSEGYLSRLLIELKRLDSNGELWSYLQPRNTSDARSFVGATSLSDYLGFKVDDNGLTDGDMQTLLTMQKELISQIEQALQDFGTNVYDTVTSPDGWNFYSEFAVASTSSMNGLSFALRFYHELEGGDSPTYAHFNIVTKVTSAASNTMQINNILAHVCYHKIYDDWYRDARVQKPLFPSALGDSPAAQLANIAYITKYGGGFEKRIYQGSNLNFYDGKSVFDLRQRLWQKDYFTSMTLQPQTGDPVTVQFDTTGDSGEFTIASLRTANAMQKWRERNNLVSPRYGDILYAQYGEYPSDAVTDRAIYLGSATTNIYNKSVYQQGSFDGATNNPFNSIGSKYATPVGVGDGGLCNNYEVKEHGILMAITSMVPEVYYSSGSRRFFSYNDISDIAFPLLQGVGDQPVYAKEIVDNYIGTGDDTIIGYTGRYNEYKFINDHLSGLLRDGQSLKAFALQRSFSEAPTLGTEFLEIPRDYMDQVSAVGVENSRYGAWAEVYWNYRKVSKLSENSAIPTLGEMRDTHQISVPKGGTRL